MTTEYQISYSSQHATSIMPPNKNSWWTKRILLMQRAMFLKGNGPMQCIYGNCNCQLVTHNSFSSTYPQTKSLHNILYPIAHHYSLIHFRSEKKEGLDQELQPCQIIASQTEVAPIQQLWSPQQLPGQIGSQWTPTMKPLPERRRHFFSRKQAKLNLQAAHGLVSVMSDWIYRCKNVKNKRLLT